MDYDLVIRGRSRGRLCIREHACRDHRAETFPRRLRPCFWAELSSELISRNVAVIVTTGGGAWALAA
jgi:hypothetical protein